MDNTFNKCIYLSSKDLVGIFKSHEKLHAFLNIQDKKYYFKTVNYFHMFLLQNSISNYNGMSLPQLTKSQSPYKPPVVTQARSKLDHLPTI